MFPGVHLLFAGIHEDETPYGYEQEAILDFFFNFEFP